MRQDGHKPVALGDYDMFDLDGIRRNNERFEREYMNRKLKEQAARVARRDGLATVIKAPETPAETRFEASLTSADAAYLHALGVKL